MFYEKIQFSAKLIIMHIDAISSYIEKFSRDFIFYRRFRCVRDAVTSYAPGNETWVVVQQRESRFTFFVKAITCFALGH